MRRLLLITFLLLSSVTNACPELTGTYQCEFGGVKNNINVTQDIQNGHSVYDFQSEVVNTDNIAHSFPDVGPYTNIIRTGSCDNNEVVLETTADKTEKNGTELIGHLISKRIYFLNNKNDLIKDLDSTEVSLNGKESNVKLELYCKRL